MEATARWTQDSFQGDENDVELDKGAGSKCMKCRWVARFKMINCMLCEHFKDSKNSCGDLDLTQNFSSASEHRDVSAS